MNLTSFQLGKALSLVSSGSLQVPKKLAPKKIWVQRKYWLHIKILGPKQILGLDKFWFKNFFWIHKILGPENILSNKIVGP